MLAYKTPAEIVGHDGLRIVLVRGVPSPWSQAAKTIFEIKGLDYVAAPLDVGAANEEIAAWSGQNSGPVVAWRDGPPLNRWLDILLLAERLAPTPALLPADPLQRALAIGLGHEILGEGGIAWNRRLQMFSMAVKAGAGARMAPLIEKYGFPCPEAMVESALRYIEMSEALGYRQIIVSLKASHVPTAVECYSLYATKCDYPTHVGITEAGSREYGTLKSAAGIGAIVLKGIGDTIRVSLLGDPVPEIAAGFDILRACDRRVTKPEVVACPTCGRLDIDLERIVAEVEAKMAHLKNPLRISILGCLVNGFGEAKEADLGIAAGAGKGIIFKRGVPIRHVKEAEMVEALLEEVGRFEEETPALKSYLEKEKKKSALTVIG